jgi:hypothetical protein
MTAVEQFVLQCSQLATRLGIRNLVIVLHDPSTHSPKLVASPGAKDALKAKVFEWYGLPDNVEQLQKENAILQAQLSASSEADTGWET